MIEPVPFDDAALDRLLARHSTPPLGAGFADRVVAEARRADRAPAIKPAPPPRRATRRWTRRGIWAGVVAVNLIVASAIAATFSGGHFHLARVVAVVSHALHLPHHDAPAPHRAHAVRAIAATPRPLAIAAPTPPPTMAEQPVVASVPPVGRPLSEARVPLARAVPPVGERRAFARPAIAAAPRPVFHHPRATAAIARERVRREAFRPPVAAERPALAAPPPTAPAREAERSLVPSPRADRPASEAPRGGAAGERRVAPWRARLQGGQDGARAGRGWWRRGVVDGAPAAGDTREREGSAGAGASNGAASAEAGRRQGLGPAAGSAGMPRRGAGAGKIRGPRAGGGGGWRHRFGRGRRL